MALEQRLSKIEKQLFTVDGNESGKLNIVNACLFRVKQKVLIEADGLSTIECEIKRIVDNVIIVGPISAQSNISVPHPTIDLSGYTVILNASIRANEQLNPKVPIQEIERFTYEEEPIVANRRILVDECGDFYTEDNPLPVSVEDTDNALPNLPSITNIYIPLANTEHFFSLPKDTKRFLFKVRDGKSKAKIAYEQNMSNIAYITVPMGSPFMESGIDASGDITLYFQTIKPGVYVEILVWEET